MKARLLAAALALLFAGCGLTTQQIGAGIAIVGGAVEGARRAGVFGGGTKPTPGPMLPSPQCDDARGPRCDCWRSETGENVYHACVTETCPVQVFTADGRPSLCRRDVPCPQGKSALPWGPGACDWYCNPCATPTPPPHPVPTAAPTVPFRELAKNQITCIRREQGMGSVYARHVQGAQLRLVEQRPDLFTGGGRFWGNGSAGHEEYAALLCGYLEPGLECLADLGGDMSVAEWGTAMGTGFSESYHPVHSGGEILTESFLERCVPKWWEGDRLPIARATPAPTTSAQRCPALITFSAGLLWPTSIEAHTGKTCQDIDWTPRFDVYTCNNPAQGCPCNNNKPTCGTNPPNLCEPPQARVRFGGSANVRVVDDKNFRQRVCGWPGEPFSATATAPAGITDSAGRPLDLSKFYGGRIDGSL